MNMRQLSIILAFLVDFSLSLTASTTFSVTEDCTATLTGVGSAATSQGYSTNDIGTLASDLEQAQFENPTELEFSATETVNIDGENYDLNGTFDRDSDISGGTSDIDEDGWGTIISNACEQLIFNEYPESMRTTVEFNAGCDLEGQPSPNGGIMYGIFNFSFESDST